MQSQWNANEREVAEIKAIACSQPDSPVLMININKYDDGEYPNGEIYRDYMEILPKLLEEVGTKLLWRLPALDQPVGSHTAEEIRGIWYPSHKSFLSLPTAPSSVANLWLKNLCVSEAVNYRCPADVIPKK